MRNIRKNLIDKIYTLKKAVYIPIVAAAISLISYSPSNPQAINQNTEINNKEKTKKCLELNLDKNPSQSAQSSNFYTKVESGILEQLKEKDYISIIVNLYDGEFFPKDMDFSLFVYDTNYGY